MPSGPNFNFDLGYSSTEEQTRETVAPIESQLPPIAAHNASATGTDLVGYLTQLFGFSAFVRADGAVYHTYSTTGRGVEFLMGHYPLLDHAPKGRGEGDEWQVWIRRHDEYSARSRPKARASPPSAGRTEHQHHRSRPRRVGGRCQGNRGIVITRSEVTRDQS